MKKLIQIIVAILITSCSSSKLNSDIILDQKFKQCTGEKYRHLANKSLSVDTLLFQKLNIHLLSNINKNDVIFFGIGLRIVPGTRLYKIAIKDCLIFNFPRGCCCIDKA